MFLGGLIAQEPWSNAHSIPLEVMPLLQWLPRASDLYALQTLMPLSEITATPHSIHQYC
jgi:hypothetical protein